MYTALVRGLSLTSDLGVLLLLFKGPSKVRKPTAFVAPNFIYHAVAKPNTIIGLSSTNDSRLDREADLCPCCSHQYQGTKGKQSTGRKRKLSKQNSNHLEHNN